VYNREGCMWRQVKEEKKRISKERSQNFLKRQVEG
jgi:hypothetical protein